MNKRLVIIFLGVFSLTSYYCGHNRFKSARVSSEFELDYPISAQLDKIEGEVQVAVFVTKDGLVDEVKLEKSSGYEILDNAALEFVKKVDFEPARLDENTISSWTRLLLRYKLSEVHFEKNKWLDDVTALQQKINETGDASEHEKLLRRLYTQYVGLINYIKRYPDVSINYSIKNVISESTKSLYSDFWTKYPASFAVLDDFLLQYPNSSFEHIIKQDLIRELIDAEYALRMKNLGKTRVDAKTIEMIQQLQSRMDQIQKSISPVSSFLINRK